MEVPPDWAYVVETTEAEVVVKVDDAFENKDTDEKDRNSGLETTDLKEGK